MGHWIAGYWPEIILASMVIAKVLNMVTMHFSDYRGVVRWCVFLVDLFDLIKSSHGGVPGSRPPGPPAQREGRTK